MEKKSKTINKCQVSGSRDLKTILSLGYLPPVNKLRKINSSLDEDTFYPITELHPEYNAYEMYRKQILGGKDKNFIGK